MIAPVEVFVVQLARTSAPAQHYLNSCGIWGEDRDDIISAAILWCWEHRAQYSLTVTLDFWFRNVVRDCVSRHARGEKRNAATELLAQMAGKDDPEYNIRLQQGLEELRANMDVTDVAIVRLRLDYDMTDEQIAKTLKTGRATVKRRLEIMRSFLPESAHVNTLLRRAVAGVADGSDDASDILSGVDYEIERLEMPPDDLGDWTRRHPPRSLEVANMKRFKPLETYQSRVREMMNKRAGLEPHHMPDYIPPTYWRF